MVPTHAYRSRRDARSARGDAAALPFSGRRLAVFPDTMSAFIRSMSAVVRLHER